MPRTIDSLSPKPSDSKPKPKPVAEHKAGQVYRPRNSTPKAGESVVPAGAKEQLSEAQANSYEIDKKLAKAQSKRRNRTSGIVTHISKTKVAIGVLLVILIGLALGLYFNKNFRDLVTKPKPASGNFAEIGGVNITSSDYQMIKDAYISFDKKNGGKTNTGQLTRTAADEVILRASLESEAKKRNMPLCTQAIVDQSLAQQYGNRGGREAYYSYLNSEYDWPEGVMFHKQCLEYYKQQMTDLVMGGVDLYGTYIRWDNTIGFTQPEKEAYETAAKTRLEKEYLPLFAAGADERDIETKLDIGKYTPADLYDKRLNDIGAPMSKSLSQIKFSQEQYDAFDHYGEGEDDMQYINKLQREGDYTPVIKSNLGFFIIYRATRFYPGKFASLDAFRDDAISHGKISADYYLLPAKTPTKIDQPLKQKAQTINSILKYMSPTAQAAGISCFGAHGFGMEIQYRDYDTGNLIPAPMSGVNMQVNSTGDIQTPCNDEPAPGTIFGYTNVSYWFGALVYQIPNHTINPFNFQLSCWTAWRFEFGAPTGYIPLTANDYLDANRFVYGRVLSGGSVAFAHLGSMESGHYRIPTPEYRVANTADSYAIAVYFKKAAVVTPRYSIIGNKVDSFDNKTGQYSSANVWLDYPNLSVGTSPYSISGIAANQNHAISAEDSIDWFVSGYKGRYSDTTNVLNVPANTIADGDIFDVTWVYKPRPSTINAGILVRDKATDKIINPCGNATYAAQCGTDNVVLNRTSTDAVVSGYTSSGSGTTVAPNNVFSTSNLYFGNYSATYSKYATDPNLKIGGYVICNENDVLNCYDNNPATWTFVSTSNDSQTLSLSPNHTRHIYAVVEQRYKTTPTLTCSTLSGTLSGVYDDKTKLGYTIDGVKEGLIPATNGDYSFAIPDKYKDGKSRDVSLYIEIIDPKGIIIEKGIPTAALKHKCANAASCGVDTVAAAFKNGFGDLGPTGVQVVITMNNIGDSVWKNGNVATGGWSTGQHALVFSPASAQYWEVSSIERGVPGGTIEDTKAIKNGQSYKFTVTFTAKADKVNVAAVPLEWGMAFIGTDDKIAEQFGGYCNSGPGAFQPKLRAFYHPWLRAQNGSVAAVGNNGGGAIVGQSPGARGTRKYAGTNQDINQDAEFAVIAVVSGSDFCSTNMYVFGQSPTDDTGTTPTCVSSFKAYKLPADLVKVESLFADVNSLPTNCGVDEPYDPAKPSIDPGKRYTPVDSSSPFFGVPTLVSTDCPRLYKHSGNLTVFGNTMESGRGTLVVDGNVTIVSDIEADYRPGTAMNAYREDGDLAQLDARVPSFGIIASGNITIEADVTRIDASLYAKGRINTCANYGLGNTDPNGTVGLLNGSPRPAVLPVPPCSKRLVVHGGLFADGGFSFGRNFYQYGGLNVSPGQYNNPNFDYQAIPAGEEPQGNYFGGPAEDIIGNGLNLIQAPPGFENFTQSDYGRPIYSQGDFVPRF